MVLLQSDTQYETSDILQLYNISVKECYWNFKLKHLLNLVWQQCKTSDLQITVTDSFILDVLFNKI